MKQIVKPVTLSNKDVYQLYVKKLLEENPGWYTRWSISLRMSNATVHNENGKEVMSWSLWKKIIEEYYFRAKTKIIQGEDFRIGGSLGIIRMIRVERNYEKKTINWGATRKLNKFKPDGKPLLVYFTDEDYCRVGWAKTTRIPNISSYNFTAAHRSSTTDRTSASKGFRQELHRALKMDPSLKYRYKFHPYKRKK